MPTNLKDKLILVIAIVVPAAFAVGFTGAVGAILGFRMMLATAGVPN